jgi:hypothetical protein
MKVVGIYIYMAPTFDNYYGLKVIFNHHPFNPIDIELKF